MTHEREDLARHARELLAAEYDLVVVLHEENGHANAALNLRQKAANIRKGVAEIHAVRAITTALNLSLPSPPSPTEAMVEAAYMSNDEAALMGIVSKMHTAWMRRNELMGQDGGFELIEKMANLLDEIVDDVPALWKAATGALASPPHVDARARALVRETLGYAGDIRWRELAEGSPFTTIDRQMLAEMHSKARSAQVVSFLTLPDGEGGR